MTSIFNNVAPTDDNRQEEIQSYYEALVGDGKKFKDNESLARAKWEADEHIKRLEREREEQRKDMEARLNLEELVSKISSQTSGTSNSASQQQNERRDNGNSTNEEAPDINSLVEQVWERKQTELTRKSNLQTVADELRKAWGSDYVKVLNDKVKELDVSPDFLDDAAARSPKAVLSLLLGNTKQKENTNAAPPRTAVNTLALANSKSEGQRTADYYKKLRKENPKLYWSPKVQNEMHQLVLEGKLEY